MAESIWCYLDQKLNTYGACGVADAIVVEAFHDGAVFFEVEAVELILEVGSIFRGDSSDQVDVLIGMKSS